MKLEGKAKMLRIHFGEDDKWKDKPLYRAIVFGVSPLDGLSLGGAAVLLAAVSTLAAFVPARRAAAIDPVESMRAE